MFKKIVLGVLATGLIAVLVIGAVNRTNSRSEEQGGSGHGRTSEVATAPNARGGQREAELGNSQGGQGLGQGRNEQGTGNQQGTSPQAGQGGQGLGRGRSEQGAGGQQNTIPPTGQSGSGVTGQGGRGQGGGYGQQAAGAALDWRLVQGTIASITDELVTVKVSNGDLIPVEGRPLAYLIEQGFKPKIGHQVTLMGFDEAGEFKVGELTDHTDKKSVQIRDQSGRPMWSGRGQRG